MMFHSFTTTASLLAVLTVTPSFPLVESQIRGAVAGTVEPMIVGVPDDADHPLKKAYHDPLAEAVKAQVALPEMAGLGPMLFQSRIVGGTDADPGEFKFMVNWNEQCGGSLIAPNMVLTAAHCLEVEGPVRIGSDFINAGGDIREVITKCGHPSYDSTEALYDYAILMLNEPVDVFSTHKVIELNSDPSLPQDSQLLTVIGFGSISQGGPESTKLQKVDVPAIPYDVCKQQYPQIMEDINLCAGYAEGGKDSCQGDSGGPIFATRNGQPVQVGVVSFGNGCAQPNSSGVYSRVSGAYDWIQNTMSSLSAGNGCNGGGGATPTASTPTASTPTASTPTASTPTASTPTAITAPVTSPITSPVTSPVTPSAPVSSPISFPVAPAPAGFPVSSPTLSSAPVAAPTPSTNSACQDDPAGWHDVEGDEYTCTWYSAGLRCFAYGYFFAFEGKTASEACCACGGGTRSAMSGGNDDAACRDIPDWHDSDGMQFDCAFYSEGDNCANYGDSFSNFGYNANEACCACGGGF